MKMDYSSHIQWWVFIFILFPLVCLSALGGDKDKALEIFSLDIQLTPDEKVWIENHPVIRVSGPSSFPPFYWINEENEIAGIGSDYIRILMENLGVKAEYSLNLPWTDVLKKTENKELDLIALSAKSTDREKYLLFTDPIISTPLIIISRNDSPFIGSLDDLNGLKVALIQKNTVTDWLLRDQIHVIPVNVSTPLEALETVSLGKAEAYIGNLAAVTYLIAEKGLTNLKVAAPTDYGYYNLYMAVRKDWPELVSILNKGLSALSAQQKAQIQNNWLSITYEYGIRPNDIIRAVLIVTAIGALLLLASLLWNRRLAREIIIRKKTEAELKEALNNITTLQGLLPICSQCKNIRDDKGYWKELEKYIHENSDISFSHGLCPSCAKKLYGEEKWFDGIEEKDKE